MIDLHIHTKLSFDSTESEENYISCAKARGDKMLGFSEHYDYDVFIDGGDQPLADINKILTAPRCLNGIEVLRGIELGYSNAALEKYRELVREKFDYCICSVHTVGGRGDCYFPEYFNGLTQQEAYELYFNAVYESVKSNLDFQILGHLGYVARYAPYVDREVVYSNYSRIIDNILKVVIERGASLEINTSAGKSKSYTIPNIEILKRFLELGGVNITFGSDAHSAQNYKRGEERVRSLLQSLGVKRTCHYKAKQIVYDNI